MTETIDENLMCSVCGQAYGDHTRIRGLNPKGETVVHVVCSRYEPSMYSVDDQLDPASRMHELMKQHSLNMRDWQAALGIGSMPRLYKMLEGGEYPMRVIEATARILGISRAALMGDAPARQIVNRTHAPIKRTMRDLAVAIVEMRKHVGLTVEELAQRAGLTTNEIIWFERTSRKPTDTERTFKLSHAVAIASAFNMSLDELLGLTKASLADFEPKIGEELA